jgi:hypothetical protein
MPHDDGDAHQDNDTKIDPVPGVVGSTTQKPKPITDDDLRQALRDLYHEVLTKGSVDRQGVRVFLSDQTARDAVHFLSPKSVLSLGDQP